MKRDTDSTFRRHVLTLISGFSLSTVLTSAVAAQNGDGVRPPTNVTVTDSDETTVSLEWDADQRAEGYWVTYETSAGDDEWEWSWESETTIADLQPETTYAFEITAVGDDEQETAGPVEVTTAGDENGGSSGALEATEVGETTITLEWEAIDGADGYWISYDSDVSGEAVEWSWDSESTLSGLEPSTTYSVEVSPTSGADASGPDPIEVTTAGETTIDPPSGLTATDVGETTITLEWDGVDEADEYELAYTDTDAGTESQWTTSDTEATLTDLEPETPYSIEVSAVVDDTASSSDPIEVETTTPSDPPEDDFTFFIAADSHYGLNDDVKASNRRMVEEMNSIVGTGLPNSDDAVETPEAVVHVGDMTDHGEQHEWDDYIEHFGHDGTDGLLDYPAYDGLGNHDGSSSDPVRPGVAERVSQHSGLDRVSDSGLQYAWRWGQFHFVQLGICAGNDVDDIQSGIGDSAGSHDPEGAYDFLRQTLEADVGDSGRPVVIFHHYDFGGWGLDWWDEDAQDRFYDLISDYNVVLLVSGHNHVSGLGPNHDWRGIRWLSCGALQRSSGTDPGEFFVVQVAGDELTLAARTDDDWGGHQKQTTVDLGAPAE